METLPPRTAEDLERDFENPTFSTYIFIGNDTDRGWENAKLAFGLIPRLRIYRADRLGLLREAWRGTGRPVAIAFDFLGNPAVRLSSAEARDLALVVKAIKAARKDE